MNADKKASLERYKTAFLIRVHRRLKSPPLSSKRHQSGVASQSQKCYISVCHEGHWLPAHSAGGCVIQASHGNSIHEFSTGIFGESVGFSMKSMVCQTFGVALFACDESGAGRQLFASDRPNDIPCQPKNGVMRLVVKMSFRAFMQGLVTVALMAAALYIMLGQARDVDARWAAGTLGAITTFGLTNRR